MRPHCNYRNDKVAITLDCPSGMCFVACCKPNSQGGFYVPTALVYVKWNQFYYCRLDHNFEREFFIDDPMDSLLRYFSRCSKKYRNVRLINVVKWYMTPAPREKKFVKYWKFHTRMEPGKDGLVDFISTVNNVSYTLNKNSRLINVVKVTPLIAFSNTILNT